MAPRDEDLPPADDNVIPLPGIRHDAPPAPHPGRGGPSLSLVGAEEGDEDEDDLSPRPPDSTVLAAATEAVLFTAGDPVPFARLLDLLDGPDSDDLRAALALIRTRYARGGHGLRLVEVAGGWQLRTQPRYARWCARARAIKPVRLSRAALETLAIVAYEQPVTRGEVEQLRGVDPGNILRMLVERGLVRTQGHQNSPGRPLLYGTTPKFLEVFGLRDLSDLPTLRDLRELSEDDPERDVPAEDEVDELGLTDPPPLDYEE
jgi:segregation and condensation protein B